MLLFIANRDLYLHPDQFHSLDVNTWKLNRMQSSCFKLAFLCQSKCSTRNWPWWSICLKISVCTTVSPLLSSLVVITSLALCCFLFLVLLFSVSCVGQMLFFLWYHNSVIGFIVLQQQTLFLFFSYVGDTYERWNNSHIIEGYCVTLSCSIA